MKILFETKTNGAQSADRTGAHKASHTESKPPRSCPKLREAVFDDYNQIAALHIRNGLTTRSCRDWMAIWRGNPAYERFNGHFPIGWALETENREIVGLIGNIPFTCHFRGADFRGAAACSWVVDPLYRRYSMLLLNCLMTQKDIDLIVSTTVSSNSEPALRLFEWSSVPVGTWDKSAFWITNYRGFMTSVLSLKSVPMPQVIGYPVAAALFCRDALRNDSGIGTSEANCEIELCTGFDSGFDDFWEELKRQNTNVLLTHRTRETLSWHFRYAQERQSVWIVTARQASRLVAYAILDRQDNVAFRLKRVRLVDFQALGGAENVLPSVFYWILGKCREDAIDVLENPGDWLNRPGLPQLPTPYYRTLPCSVYYYKAVDPELERALKDPAVWAPTSFDGDASL